MLLLDDKQQAVVEDILQGTHQGGALIGGQMASGKTNVAVAVTVALSPRVVLLACPLKGTRIGWVRTFKRAGYEGPFFLLTNDTKENFQRLQKGEPGVYIIGREYLHLATKPRGSRPAHIDWLKVKTIDVAIFDEAHAGANRKSATFRAWSHVRPKQLKMSLSGTWFGNRFKGAWAITRALWPGLIDASFWRWAEKWARPLFSCPKCHLELEDDAPGHCPRCMEYVTARSVIRDVSDERIPGAFAATLPSYYSWEADLDADDPAGLPPDQEELFVELSPKHRKAYRQMEERGLAWLDEHPLAVDLPLTKKIRLRQIALAYPTVADDDTVTYKPEAESPKIDALNEWLENHPDDNVLVATDSRQFAEILPGRLKGEVTLWTGGTSTKERERILMEWGLDKTRRHILVATIPAMAEGVDGLQHVCSTLVWMNKHSSAILNDQFRARLLRRGQTARVREVTITAVETEDEPDNTRVAQITTRRLASQGGENVSVRG